MSGIKKQQIGGDESAAAALRKCEVHRHTGEVNGVEGGVEGVGAAAAEAPSKGYVGEGRVGPRQMQQSQPLNLLGGRVRAATFVQHVHDLETMGATWRRRWVQLVERCRNGRRGSSAVEDLYQRVSYALQQPNIHRQD